MRFNVSQKRVAIFFILIFDKLQFGVSMSQKSFKGYLILLLGEKGRDLTQSCDKNPFTHRTIKKATWQHKNATKNFDYTTIEDRLRTVSWSNGSHPTGVVKPVYERSTFPLTATAV